MKTSKRFFVSIATLALWAGAMPSSAADISQELGAYWQHSFLGPAGTARQSKFEEYHPIPNGVVIDHYQVDVDTDNYEFSFGAKNVNQDDQEYKASGGRPGAFKWSAEWNQTPHVLAYNARSLYVTDGNTLTMTPAVRGSGSANAAYLSSMTAALNNTPYVPLGLQTEEAKLDLSFHPGKDWTLSLGADRMHRFGTKAMGATFGFSNTVELPQPVDHMMYGLKADIGVAKKQYQANLHYDLSTFHNNFSDIIFDNPQVRASVYNTSSQGRMALEPDNQAHNFSLSGGIDLPGRTHFSGEVGTSFWRQNAGLDSMTINPNALTGSQQMNGWGVDPYLSADRKIDIYTQSYRLSNAYFDRFRTSLAYRSYIMINRSGEYTFPGYVTYDAKFSTGPFTTEQFGYAQNDVDWKGDLELTKKLSLGGAYTYEFYKSDREISKSYEQRFQLGTTYKPAPGFFMNLSYLVALRRMKAYDPASLKNSAGTGWTEAPGLIRFDVGDRNRNQGRVQVQYTHGDSSYGLSYRVTQDHYRPGRVPLDGADSGIAPLQQFKQYGLLSNDNQAAGLNFTQVLGDDVDLDAYYEHDYTRMIIQSNSGSPMQDVSSDWQQRYAEQSNVGGISLGYKPRYDVKMTASYDLVATVGHLDFIQDPGTKINGVAAGLNSLPSIRRTTQTLGFKTRYQATKTLGLTARYQYFKYNVQDYAVNDIPLLAPNGQTMYLGASQKDFFAHTMAFGADYRF